MNKRRENIDKNIASRKEAWYKELLAEFPNKHWPLTQSCPWVGLTRGLGWVGSGMGRKFVFSGLGWVMGLKWQMYEKYMSCIYVTLYRVNAGKFVFL